MLSWGKIDGKLLSSDLYDKSQRLSLQLLTIKQYHTKISADYHITEINASKIIPAIKLISMPPYIVQMMIPNIGCLASQLFILLYSLFSQSLSISQKL